MNSPSIQFQGDTVILTPPADIPGGVVSAIPSKSHAHRLLIAAALGSSTTRLICPATSKDIEATAACLQAMGAEIQRTEDGFLVSGIMSTETQEAAQDSDQEAARGSDYETVLPVGESGSTLRFLLPVLGALGCPAALEMQGRLPERPLSPLYEELCRHGMNLAPMGSNPFRVSGRMTAGEYVIDGGVSSQYITGLLFALPLLPQDSTLRITGRLESRPYVEITLKVLRQFGIRFELSEAEEIRFTIPGGQKYRPAEDAADLSEQGSENISAPVCRVEGDWSNAAFFLAAGALLSRPVTVTGCDTGSPQGDRAITTLLRDFGADVKETPSGSPGCMDITVTGGELKGIDIDATHIPDLVPILSVVASCAEGTTIIRNIERLRIKESDRVETVLDMLRNLGAEAEVKKDPAQGEYLSVTGARVHPGGTVSSYNDHRIAMAAAIAFLRCTGPVRILQPMAVNKSYPGFYDDLASILN